MQLKIIAAVICCTVMTLCSFGQQTPYLEKPVTLRQSTLSYDDLFRQLSNQTGVVFSYTNFDASRKVSVKAYSRKQLRVVLNDLFNESGCSYKMKGKYVILTCKAVAAKPKATPNNNVVVNGYVYSAADSTLLAKSSVYLRQNRQSALTDEYGYFSLSFPKTSDLLTISVAKENFEDTSVVILSQQRNTIVIYLQPKASPVKITVIDTVQVDYPSDTLPQQQPPVAATADTAKGWLNTFWEDLRARHSNLRNISDTLFTNVSFSLFPPISTNRLLAVNTVNRLSFNALVGHSKGVDLMEIGGLVNIDFGNVQYLQVAGLTNLVSGRVRGLQLAGLVNITGGRVDGMQVAGLVNVSRTAINGMQLAGIANRADTVRGIQFSAFTNSAQYVEGLQWSVFHNHTDYLKGCQLGLINVANIATGVPIGFFSFVRTGYHKMELAYDENKMATLSFRTGVDRLHNIFLAGLRPFGSGHLWTFGYGLGTSGRITDKWRIGIDWTEQNFQIPNQPITLNVLSKWYLGLEWRPYRYFNVTAGPTFNFLVSSASIGNPGAEATFERIYPAQYTTTGYEHFTTSFWVGWKVAVRFL